MRAVNFYEEDKTSPVSDLALTGLGIRYIQGTVSDLTVSTTEGGVSFAVRFSVLFLVDVSVAMHLVWDRPVGEKRLVVVLYTAYQYVLSACGGPNTISRLYAHL